MKLTAKVKLLPDTEQHKYLLETLETTNAACNEISNIAWQERTFNQFGLQKLVYIPIREATGLTAQVVIRTISKVADAYKLDKRTKRTFKPHGGIAYDARILRWFVDKQEVSIWSTGGRLRIPFVCGQRQLELLAGQRGETDLCLVDGKFYLFAACEIETPDPSDVDGFLGVDLGIADIAVDSTGEVHQGKAIRAIRYRRRQLRRKLQAKGTKSTRRRLRKLSGKEQRFATDTNHVISKRIVEKAKCTGQGIAVEELTGIRGRVKARKPQRATLHSWSFHQLRQFIEYKAKMLGVPVVAVDPRNTSRTCPCCGHVDKANRKTQDEFLCVDCGYSGLADYIAAVNIGRRAVVNPPHVSDAIGTLMVAPGTSQRALAVGH
ncbi:MAG: transposase [Caldilineaceae bacterium]|nr:transposase [Caldilineaceae bacterium]